MGRVDRVHGFTAPGLLFACLGACQAGQTGDPLDPRPHQPPNERAEVSPLGGPSITMVRNEDGGVQVREASATRFVVTGTELAGATSATVQGCYETVINSATATEVRVTSQCFSMPRGALLSVSVTTPGGTATLPDAILVTPFVFSPAAPLGGRGTYESPMPLCDPELELWIGGGNKMELLGGTHVCGDTLVLFGNVQVEGALDGSTVIEGDGGNSFTISMNGSAGPVEIRRLTFRELGPGVSLSLNGADFTIEDVSGGRVEVLGAPSITLDDYSFDGAGGALNLQADSFTLSDIDVRCQSGSDTGIRLAERQESFTTAQGTLARIAVEHCARGLHIARVDPFTQEPALEIDDLVLVDNVVALQMDSGQVTVRELEIRGDATTPLVSQVGVDFSGHHLSLLGGEILGQTLAGISQVTSSSGGFPDPVAQLFVDRFEIAGGQVGVELQGYDGGTDLKIRRSVIRDQTVACLRGSGYESWMDLGTVEEPGGNALSVVSGYAIDDIRTDTNLGWHFYLDARGTTLNGLGYDTNVIDGPALIPLDFRIATSRSGIRF